MVGCRGQFLIFGRSCRSPFNCIGFGLKPATLNSPLQLVEIAFICIAGPRQPPYWPAAIWLPLPEPFQNLPEARRGRRRLTIVKLSNGKKGPPTIGGAIWIGSKKSRRFFSFACGIWKSKIEFWAFGPKARARLIFSW